ncbi:MAG: ParA family protein [Halobacteriales archaeon]|nr:ParA family protein [Halobacteriales archaeon]
MFAIALANQKGGVGKTTNTVNIAGALAARDHRVLVVDFDPQGYLSITLGFRETYQNTEAGLSRALERPSQVDREELIVSHPEFDLIPADQGLGTASPQAGATDRVFNAVAEGHYDFVIADMPPSQNAYTDVVLSDIKDVFVPMEVSEASVYAVKSLVDHIVELEQTRRAGIRIRAILLSDVNYPLDNEQKRIERWVEDNFGDKCPIYEIRHRAAVQRSLRVHSSIFGPDAEETDMTEVYATIARQIEGINPHSKEVVGERP